MCEILILLFFLILVF